MILDTIEHKLEKILNIFFAKTFKAQLQPLEIFQALKKEMESNTQLISSNIVFVPHSYYAKINRYDFDNLNSAGGEVISYIANDLKNYALQKGYQLKGNIEISILPDDFLAIGCIETGLQQKDIKEDIKLIPALCSQNDVYYIEKNVVFLGRSVSQNDIVINTPSISKQHLKISYLQNGNILLEDLNSTNGTFVGSRRISAVEIPQNTAFRIGSQKFIYKKVIKA